MAEKKKYTEYKNRFNAEKYDRLNIMLPKGRKAALKAFLQGKGESVNEVVNRLLRGYMGLTEAEWYNRGNDGES